MDLSQYADLFLVEAREHLTACNELLLEWERHPAAREPVSGLFRSVHTVKGMAATMGYARVADLAHRAESVLDSLRRGSTAVTDELLQLLFRTVDGLERAVELSVTGRERELDVAALTQELERAGTRLAPGAPRAAPRAAVPPHPSTVAEPPAVPAAGRLVQVTLRPEAPLKGGRALVALRKAQGLGAVHAVSPPPAAFEAEDFDGRFAFRLESGADAAAIAAAVKGAGDVEEVAVGEGEETAPRVAGAGAPGGGGGGGRGGGGTGGRGGEGGGGGGGGLISLPVV